MPRNVRNWWLELEVDGRKTMFESGPRRADGGFRLRILQRDRGGILDTGELRGRVIGDVLVMTLHSNEFQRDRANFVVETAR